MRVIKESNASKLGSFYFFTNEQDKRMIHFLGFPCGREAKNNVIVF